MGSIILRKRGYKWEYRFEIVLIDGRREFLSKGDFRTKKDYCCQRSPRASRWAPSHWEWLRGYGCRSPRWNTVFRDS